MGPTGTTPDVWVLHLLADGTLDWDMPIENDGTDLGLGIAAMADGGAASAFAVRRRSPLGLGPSRAAGGVLDV